MPRQAVPIFIIIMTLLAAVAIYFGFFHTETQRLKQVATIAKSPSRIYARMLVRYEKPPIFRKNGVWRISRASQPTTIAFVRGTGKQITITSPPHQVYDVSFFIGHLDQDGVWQIVDKEPPPDADAHYTVYVKQVADYKQGDRTVTFTDPHYWATTAGRLYTIDLSKGVPSDLVHIRARRLPTPATSRSSKDFRDFRPDDFRRNVEAAQAKRIRGTHG